MTVAEFERGQRLVREETAEIRAEMSVSTLLDVVLRMVMDGVPSSGSAVL